MSERPQTEPVPWGVAHPLVLWGFAYLASAVWISLVAEVSGVVMGVGAPPGWLLIGQFALWASYGLGPLLIAREASHFSRTGVVATKNAGGGGVGLKERFALQWDPWDLPIWGAVGVFFQLVVVGALYIPLSYVVDVEELNAPAEDLAESATSTTGLIILFFVLVVMAPITEELFFRGFALPPLIDRFGVWTGIVLSSVWFAISHFQLIQFPGLLVVGLGLAYARLQTGRLVPAMAMHLGFNAAAFGVLLAQHLGTE